MTVYTEAFRENGYVERYATKQMTSEKEDPRRNF